MKKLTLPVMAFSGLLLSGVGYADTNSGLQPSVASNAQEKSATMQHAVGAAQQPATSVLGTDMPETWYCADTTSDGGTTC